MTVKKFDEIPEDIYSLLTQHTRTSYNKKSRDIQK